MSKNIIIIGFAFIGLSVFLWWKFGRPVAGNSAGGLGDQFKTQDGATVYH